MRVIVTQRFASSAEAVAGAYLQAGLYPGFGAIAVLSDVAVLGIETIPKATVVRVRSRFAAELPALVTKFVDPRRLTWVEVASYRDDGSATFRVVADHYAKLLRFAGTISLDADGHRGCVRRIQGELVVDLGWAGRPFVASAEAAIAKGLSEALAAQVPIVESFIDSP